MSPNASRMQSESMSRSLSLKLEFHDADTDTDILARVSARKSDRILRHRHPRQHPRDDFRGDVDVLGESARILARKSVSVSVSASWNASLTTPAGGSRCVDRVISGVCHCACVRWIIAKRLQLSTPNLAHIHSTAGHRHAPTQRSKRPKVKVTELWSVLPARICMSSRLLRCLVSSYMFECRTTTDLRKSDTTLATSFSKSWQCETGKLTCVALPGFCK